MSDQQDEQLKQSNEDSVFPDMDLKRIGESSKSSSQRSPSRDHSVDNLKAVAGELVEEEEDEEGEHDAEDMLKSKSKFKHVNIFTDSDEFNQTKTNVTEHILRHATTMTSSTQVGENNAIAEEEDTRAADEEDAEAKSNPLRDAALKLNVSVQLVENSLFKDKGEFECNSPSRLMMMSGGGGSSGSWKKIGNPMCSSQSSMFSSQFNAAEEVEALEEEPAEKEDEEDGNGETAGERYSSKLHSSAKSNEVNISRVDEIFMHKNSVSKYVANSNDTDVQAIAEEEEEAKNEDEDTTLSTNAVLKSAKLEREQQKDFIKKLVTGDKIKEAEKVMQIVEASESQTQVTQSPAIAEEEDDDREGLDDAEAGLKKLSAV